MEFKDLLLLADQKSKLAVKQSQQVKRLDTSLQTPSAKKENKTEKPKSEALQKLIEEKEREKRKLIEEKEREKRKKREAEERERRKKEEARKTEKREEKRKNAFRIPKKSDAQDDAPSDADSFSSISSDEGEGDPEMLARVQRQLEKQKESKGQSEEKHSSTDKSSSKHSTDKSSSSKHSSSKSSSSSKPHSSSQSSSKHADGGGSSKKTSDGHSSDRHKHSSSHKERHSSDKDKHSSDKHSSEKDRHSSDKSRHSSSHGSGKSSSTSHNKSHSSKSDSKDSSHKSNSKDSAHKSSSSHSSKRSEKELVAKAENESSGYITSPDITSESSGDESDQDKAGVIHQRRTSNMTESGENFTELTRHHLKPILERQGCAMDIRTQTLAKLQAIKDRMAAREDTEYSRKRAARGDVKKRRAKREKMDGDFSGPCRDLIEYDEEEKPSLKRPDPKPEEFKPEKVKKEKKVKEKRERSEKHRKSGDGGSHRSGGGSHRSGKSDSHRSGKSDSHRPGKSDSHRPGKSDSHKAHRNIFDSMSKDKDSAPKEKPKIKRRFAMPPPVSFAELMKIAAEKVGKPALVEAAPKKKEKEKRPMTQDEIDRKRARAERVKTQEYKDWYMNGEEATKSKSGAGGSADTSGSGGFLRKEHNVVPPSTAGRPSAGGHSPSGSSSSKPTPSSTSTGNPRPSSSSQQPSASAPLKGFKAQVNPARPATITNKPQAMAKHANNGHRESTAPPPKAKTSIDKPRGGNAWDSLFNRPEYKKMSEPPAKKKPRPEDVSEEEDYDDDDYDDEDDLDDFIDDGDGGDMNSVSAAIQQMFGYDRKKFRDEDYDDRDMEVGFSQVMKEEARSARLGRKEDLEDMRLEAEELKRKAMKRKMQR